MPTTHYLAGCRAEPLGSYLKALGVLRLVNEQADGQANARWAGDCFVLTCGLNREAIERFFLQEYRPTPVVAPWNGGSGFAEKDKNALEAVRLIAASLHERLAVYRAALTTAQHIGDLAEIGGWSKGERIEACRGQLPEGSVAWVDATVVLTAGKPGYPPVLGTGGNDRRMDFSANFMHRLCDVLGLRGGKAAPKPETRQQWLSAALFADFAVAGLDKAVGQFDAGAAGGANSAPTGQAPSVVNPWDFVLMIEGALVLAGAAARRMGSDTQGRASMPFMMDSSAAGYASGTDAENSRGEMWLPLWRRPAGYAEISHLVGEGRSEWRGRQARSGLDMARAVATLGVDRGIDTFVRHAFLERRGQSTAVVPVGRMEVRRRAGVSLLSQLDQWLGRARREPPAGVAAAIARVDRAMYALAMSGGFGPLQAVLAALSDAEVAAARSPTFRKDTRLRPLQGLKANDWLHHLDDATPEFRLAAALASLRDDDGTCLRHIVRPVAAHGRALEWSEGPAPVPGFGTRPLAEVLAAAHARRAVEAGRSLVHSQNSDTPGIQTAFTRRVPAPLADVAAFAMSQIDDGRLERLLAGLLLLDWAEAPQVGHWFRAQLESPPPPPPAWAVLAPFFHGRPLQGGTLRLTPESTWPAQLAAGQLQPVVAAGLRRLRMARIDPALADTAALARTPPAGVRLGAALLIPVSGKGCDALLRRVAPTPIGTPAQINQPASLPDPEEVS